MKLKYKSVLISSASAQRVGGRRELVRTTYDLSSVRDHEVEITVGTFLRSPYPWFWGLPSCLFGAMGVAMILKGDISSILLGIVVMTPLPLLGYSKFISHAASEQIYRQRGMRHSQQAATNEALGYGTAGALRIVRAEHWDNFLRRLEIRTQHVRV